MKIRVKSPWILQQERDSNLRGIAYIAVAVILITSIMTLRSCAYGSPSMVPAGVNVDTDETAREGGRRSLGEER